MRGNRLYRLCIWTLVVSCTASWINAVLAEPIRVGFNNHPPMMIEATKKGIYHDIFDAIERMTGETFEISYYPYIRSKLLLEANEVDITPGISPEWTKNLKVPGVFTIPFAKSVDVILFSQGKKIPVEHPGALRGKSLGAVRGYFYPGFMEYFDSGAIVKVEGRDEAQTLAILSQARVDQIIINRVIAQYWMSRNSSYKKFEIGDVVGEVDIMMRLHPSKQHLIPIMNKAIEKMIESGEIQNIYSKYQ